MYPKSKKEYIPPKKFLWDLFSTLNNELALKFVKYSIDQRAEEAVEGEKTIEIAEEILDEVKQFRYFSKKRGKALHMMKAKKEFTDVKRKRRREIASFTPEEIKGPPPPKRFMKSDDPASKSMINIPKRVKPGDVEKEKRLNENNDEADMEVSFSSWTPSKRFQKAPSKEGKN